MVCWLLRNHTATAKSDRFIVLKVFGIAWLLSCALCFFLMR
jgi:hypothetical protein